ncbi:ubiquitin-conjugating enzyme/RWD-like protein [Microdochium trichocladiopsis]|uniref:Ubiquitin-conjugating enzyme E2 2 n=1 Tax=Microdochium trichocladiopsis TaxID=1682393 RepID=A0A9P8YAJ1_9PEZI|nr:ubiquitin-conjugating enzyme/RWD-like protein [Microdochium trichocladiopsis]KAH7032647.1 ubiquitin-conjugating enzyme/RWD-like protein [Microdochium trichocladiopsis]
MSSRTRRIAKEMGDIEADRASNLYVALADPASGNLTHLKASILGPPGTPYEGGTFMVDIKIPNDYPFRPPVMKFDTKVWHPNISSQTGAICLDTLSTRWSPVMTIRSTLLSLQSLFESPEPKDPQDAEVAKMMIHDLDGFNRKAHEWAVRHAGAPHNPKLQSVQPRSSLQASPSVVDDSRRYQGYNRELVNRFVSMGFDVDRVVEAFLFVGIDKNNGLDYELEEAYMGDITARLLGEP